MKKQLILLAVFGLLTALLAACSDRAPTPTPVGGDMETTLEAGGMDTEGDATIMAAAFDARFIDSMIEHHQGAIEMAEQALEESEREEIRTLAQNIITTQQQEIDSLTTRDEARSCAL